MRPASSDARCGAWVFVSLLLRRSGLGVAAQLTGRGEPSREALARVDAHRPDGRLAGNGSSHAVTVGAELTFVWARSGDGFVKGPVEGPPGFGLLIDAVWVSNPSQFRGTVGAQVSWVFGDIFGGGLEAGATFQSRDAVVGFRARGFVTFFGPTLYVGVDYHEDFAAEVGLLLKFPFEL